MATQKEGRPAVGNNGTAQKSYHGDESSVPDVRGTRLIGASVGAQLERELTRLVSGEIGLHELDPGLAAWYTRGYHDGQVAAGENTTAALSKLDTVTAELARVNAECDRLSALLYGVGVI